MTTVATIVNERVQGVIVSADAEVTPFGDVKLTANLTREGRTATVETWVVFAPNGMEDEGRNWTENDLFNIYNADELQQGFAAVDCKRPNLATARTADRLATLTAETVARTIADGTLNAATVKPFPARVALSYLAL